MPLARRHELTGRSLATTGLSMVPPPGSCAPFAFGPAPQAPAADIPMIDLEKYLNRSADPRSYEAECRKVADALHRFGVLIVRDPRVNETHNSTFLDMMERYFSRSDGEVDARPELHYQVGVTPGGREKPRDHCARYGDYGPRDRPVSLCPPEYDPKWRFFWRVGSRPKDTEYPQLAAEKVVPAGFPEWETVMNTWGGLMMQALHGVAGMAAEGFGLEPDAFQRRMECGPHLLAPTGSDFNRHGQLHTVLAGFHYDLNFLTIHGKSRFAGQHIWTRDGRRRRAVVPDGCLLVQAGKQLEYATGGHCKAGFHEVVVTSRTIEQIEKRRREGRCLWRVSSTCFGHLASDVQLQPLGHFATEEALAKYPARAVGQLVSDELKAIMLQAQ